MTEKELTIKDLIFVAALLRTTIKSNVFLSKENELIKVNKKLEFLLTKLNKKTKLNTKIKFKKLHYLAIGFNEPDKIVTVL
jgi:hypothetical protein